MSVMLRVSVDVNTPDITAPFPLDRFNFANVQPLSSVSALLRERSDALNPMDSIGGVVTWAVTVTVFIISLQLDEAVMSVYARVDCAVKMILVISALVPLQVKRGSVMPEAKSCLVTASDPDGRIETVPEEKEVDSDSAVCVPSASSIESDSNVDA